MNEHKKKNNSFLFFFSLVGILHALFLALHFKEIPKETSPRRIIVKLKSDPFKNKRQIVQSRESESKRKMDDAFLSDKDRYFDRETRARVVDRFQSSSGGGGKKSGRKDIKLSDLGMQKGEDPFSEAAKEYTRKKKGETGANPNPTVSSTSDYLKDIPLGDLTQLNTVEYKYYGFYFRIKQKLEQFWGRSLHQKANEMVQGGRRVASSEEFITALEITLDHQGEIIAIKVMAGSGVKELDDAAIESFNEAGPFPNPPKGLVENGKVKLEWGFVVKS